MTVSKILFAVVQVILFVFSAIIVLVNYSVKKMCEGDGDKREENSTCGILKNN